MVVSVNTPEVHVSWSDSGRYKRREVKLMQRKRLKHIIQTPSLAATQDKETTSNSSTEMTQRIILLSCLTLMLKATALPTKNESGVSTINSTTVTNGGACTQVTNVYVQRGEAGPQGPRGDPGPPGNTK